MSINRKKIQEQGNIISQLFSNFIIYKGQTWEIGVLQNDFTGSPRQIAHTYRYQVCIVNRGGAAERASGELVGLPADYVLSLMDCQSPQS